MVVVVVVVDGCNRGMILPVDFSFTNISGGQYAVETFFFLRASRCWQPHQNQSICISHHTSPQCWMVSHPHGQPLDCANTAILARLVQASLGLSPNQSLQKVSLYHKKHFQIGCFRCFHHQTVWIVYIVFPDGIFSETNGIKCIGIIIAIIRMKKRVMRCS